MGNGLGLNQIQYCIMEGDIGEERLTPIAFTMITVPYDNQAAAREA